MLQVKGEEILAKTNLLEELSKVGEVHLVGNMAFETTIKPDIDIQIYPKSNFNSAAEQVVQIFNRLNILNAVIRKLKISKKTLILGKFSHDNEIWNIDVSLTNKSADYLYDSYSYYKDNQDKINEETRKLIIFFKKELCKEKIIFDNPSYYIYRGVFEKNIKNLDEMKLYLKNMKEQMLKEKS